MVMTLSDRFDQIDAKRVVVKPVMNTGAAQRRDDMDSRRKVGRQTQFETRRQGMTNAKPAMRAAQAKAVAPRQQQQVQMQRPSQFQGRGQGRGFRGGRAGQNQQKMAGRGRTGPVARGGGRGAGRGVTVARGPGRGDRQQVGSGRGAAGAASRGRGRGGRQGGRGNKDDKAEEKDLDEGLDEYWFKAGKGPDPKVASLDRGLDNYWNTKNAAGGAGDAGKSEEKAAENGVEMSDVAAPAAEVDPDL